MLQNRKIILIVSQLIIVFTCIEQSKSTNTRQLDLQQKLLEERELKTDEMLTFMNFKAKACKDFYDYACGKWLPKQFSYLASKGDEISVQSLMVETVNRELQVVLNESITSLDTMDTRLAKNYYVACLNVSDYSLQKQFARSLVLSYGGLPDVTSISWSGNYNWLNVVADLHRKYNFDILIGLTIDYSSANQKAIYVEEPKTTILPKELCSYLAMGKIKENGAKLLSIENKIKNNFLKWFDVSEENAKRKAKTIVNFELELCKYMRIENNGDNMLNSNNEDQTVQNIRYSTNIYLQNIQQLSEHYLINFEDFIQRSLDINVKSQIYFRSEKYFEQLKNLNQKGLEATFANYIMYRALEEISFPFQDKAEQRQFYCAQQVLKYLPQVLAKLYNEKNDLEEKKTDVKEIFLNIKRAIADHVQNNIGWLSENTKNMMQQKLHKLNIKFPSYPQDPDILKGLPLHDVLRGLPVQDNQTYWQKLQTIMMYQANQTVQQLHISTDRNLDMPAAVSIQIQPLTNVLVVGYGLMQKPFYSHLHSKAFKYSSMGVTIAKEIIKLFDLQNPFNNYPYDPLALQYFSEQSECFRLQMSHFLYNKPFVYSNASKIRELMMETTAINVAFTAYLNWLNVKERRESELQLETLPDIDFTNTQLFFINYAQSRCSALYNVQLAPKYLPLFRRNLQQYSINGPLINNKEFSRDFVCELGVSMNLDDKCLFY